MQDIDATDELAEILRKLVHEFGIELPCTLTIDDGTVHLIVTAERDSNRSYEDENSNDPDNRVFIIKFTFHARPVY